MTPKWTKKKLQKIGLMLQKEFNIPEWTISYEFCDMKTLAEQIGCSVEKNNLYGASNWIPEDKSQARIWILHPRELRKHGVSVYATLIHELLHIRLEGHKSKTPYNLEHERALNDLSAFVERVLFNENNA